MYRTTGLLGVFLAIVVIGVGSATVIAHSNRTCADAYATSITAAPWTGFDLVCIGPCPGTHECNEHSEEMELPSGGTRTMEYCVCDSNGEEPGGEYITLDGTVCIFYIYEDVEGQYTSYSCACANNLCGGTCDYETEDMPLWPLLTLHTCNCNP